MKFLLETEISSNESVDHLLLPENVAILAHSPPEPQPATFLRWAGSKKKLLTQIQEFWSTNFDRYVEPFAGSACLFFKLRPKAAFLSDKNAQLIHTFRMVADNPKKIYKAVTGMERDAETYYKIRATNPKKLGKFEQAVRFIYLNRNCFNGIYRTNRSGDFNVPFGGEKAGELVAEDVFVASATLLRNATLQAWDFGQTLRCARAGDFVYLDPPYAVNDRRVFREYSGKPFTTIDLARLSDHLDKMDARGIKFLVSYADSKEANTIASHWNSQVVSVRRNIAGFTGARKNAAELLFTNIDT